MISNFDPFKRVAEPGKVFQTTFVIEKIAQSTFKIYFYYSIFWSRFYAAFLLKDTPALNLRPNPTATRDRNNNQIDYQ